MARERVVVMQQPVWRLAIEHTTTYRYSDQVRASFNEVRVVPQSNRRQIVLETRVTTTPPAPLYRYNDYWGTHVLAFDIAGAHDLLRVCASAVVETRGLGEATVASWDDVAAARGGLYELCVPTPYTQGDDELSNVALGLRGPDPVATVKMVSTWVNDALEYAPGTTGVHTSALEAWRARRGVCQDYTHLAITVLRALGIPARYVSGYLHPEEDAAVGAEHVGESHAWVEAWTGDWWGIDPTNDAAVGPRHVVVAHGRDYSDVPPVKGIYAGTAEDDLDVEVKVTRVA